MGIRYDCLQRLNIATDILMMSYFGCEPVSIFDTRVRFQGEDDDKVRAVRDNIKYFQ